MPLGYLTIYAKKVAILLHMALISSKRCTFSKKIKSLVWNKVHAPWKNACKINKRTGTFIPYLRVHERSFVDSQLLGIAVNNFRIITGNGKMETLGISTIGEMAKVQLMEKTVLQF